MTSHSNHEVPAVLVMCLQEDCLLFFLKCCSACERDGAHNMPLNHSAQTTAAHNNPEPFFLFFYFLIVMVSAGPGLNDVGEYFSWLVSSFHWSHFGQYKECLEMWTNSGLCWRVCGNNN